MLVRSEVAARILGANFSRPLEAVFLFVGDGPAVFTSSFSEFCRYLRLLHTLRVPLVDASVFFLLLLLWTLMRQSRALRIEVPGSIGNVLGNVRVDVFSRFVDGSRSRSSFSHLLELPQLFVVAAGLLLIPILRSCILDHSRDGNFGNVCHGDRLFLAVGL